MDPTRFSILLNARDADGCVVYADGRGGAYVFKPYPPGFVPPPMPTGYSYRGIEQNVPRPASMQHRFFDEHAHAEIYTDEKRTAARVVQPSGNPPPPPRIVALPNDL